MQFLEISIDQVQNLRHESVREFILYMTPVDMKCTQPLLFRFLAIIFNIGQKLTRLLGKIVGEPLKAEDNQLLNSLLVFSSICVHENSLAIG